MSLVQRKFNVGYSRAGRIVDQLAEHRVIGGYQGSKSREVLMNLPDVDDLLEKIGLEGNVLDVLDREDDAAFRSFRNLPDVQLILRGELNAYDILCNDWVVFTKATLLGAEVEAPPAQTSAPVEEPQTTEEPAES